MWASEVISVAGNVIGEFLNDRTEMKITNVAKFVLWQKFGSVVAFGSQDRYIRLAKWALTAKGVKFTGDPLWISPDVTFDTSDRGQISVGFRSVIAQDVVLLTHDYSMDRIADAASEFPPDDELISYGPIVVEDYAFIGARSIILPNCVVGRGSVVAAGSVVTKSIPPNTVWGGNPAKEIASAADFRERSGYRFELKKRRK